MKTSFDSAFGFRQIWNDYQPTRLLELPGLASEIGVARVFAKLECERPLGNFKVLGGVMAGLRALARAVGATTLQELSSCSELPQLICASDGNHGLAVAFAAQRAGARAKIYLPTGASQIRFDRIAGLGADVVTVTGTYDDAVAEAAAAAGRGEGILVPDTTADVNDMVVQDVMKGYGLLGEELERQFARMSCGMPTHAFVQAGVGGLAAAIAQGFRHCMRQPGRLIVVEPLAAPSVAMALAAGRPVTVQGDLQSVAEMLSCGLASAPAIEILLLHEARSVLVAEAELAAAVLALAKSGGPKTTPSGAAGLAGLLGVCAKPALRTAHQLGSDSSVLLVVSEAAPKPVCTSPVDAAIASTRWPVSECAPPMH